MTSGSHVDNEAASPLRRGARPLGVAHFQWWSRAFGAKYEAAASVRVAREPSNELLDSLFRSIRDNHVGQVQRILDVYPHLGFTKRTALYIASFFARFEIVKLLLARGADRQLLADGVPPSAVVGYGRSDAVDEMKVRCLLGDTREIHVLLLLAPQDSKSSTDIASMSPTRRVHVHFSEPVGDFIEDDLQTKYCTIEKFTQMSADFFTVTVRVANKGTNTPASIEVPAGVVVSGRAGAKKHGDKPAAIDTNAASNILHVG